LHSLAQVAVVHCFLGHEHLSIFSYEIITKSYFFIAQNTSLFASGMKLPSLKKFVMLIDVLFLGRGMFASETFASQLTVTEKQIPKNSIGFIKLSLID
jgi:hypothetical protein